MLVEPCLIISIGLLVAFIVVLCVRNQQKNESVAAVQQGAHTVHEEVMQGMKRALNEAKCPCLEGSACSMHPDLGVYTCRVRAYGGKCDESLLFEHGNYTDADGNWVPSHTLSTQPCYPR